MPTDYDLLFEPFWAEIRATRQYATLREAAYILRQAREAKAVPAIEAKCVCDYFTAVKAYSTTYRRDYAFDVAALGQGAYDGG